MRHHPGCPRRPGLLVGLGKQNDVAIERRLAPVQVHHHGQFRREIVLIIFGAAAIDVAVLLDAGEGIHRPLRTVRGHHIAMGDQQERTLVARSPQPRHEVQALRIVAQQLR